MTERAIVAQFYKTAGGRFELWSLVSIENKKAKDGSDETWFMRTTYDVDLSHKFGYLYYQSGCGGSGPVSVDGIYFTSGEVTVKEEPNQLCERSKTTLRWKTKEIRARNKTRRLRKLPKLFRSEFDLLEWLELNGINQPAIWCSECKDIMPEDKLCEHCWWCETNGWYSTPSERCGHKREECQS
jgi:hypothetical protein